jgi:hypothetical protein
VFSKTQVEHRKRHATCSRKWPALTTVPVEPLAVFAEPVAAITVPALRLGNIPARRASTVVVVDTMLSGLLDFVH